MRHIFQPGFHYAKYGVMLTVFTPEGSGQADLFDDCDPNRSHWLMQAPDVVNHRIDRDTVFYAGSGTRRDWKAFATMKSRYFTTDYKHLLEVRTPIDAWSRKYDHICSPAIGIPKNSLTSGEIRSYDGIRNA